MVREILSGMIDAYQSFLPSGKPYKTIYLNLYSSNIPTKVPNGFVLKPKEQSQCASSPQSVEKAIVDVKDRDRSYAAADRLRPSLGKDTSVLEVRWDSMVFNWHCNLSVDGEPVALGGMQRYRLLLPSGKHNIVFSCEGKRLSVGKAIDLDSDKVVSLAIKSGILGQKLIIQ